MTLNVFSYGGGKQSTAALVLAAQGRLSFDAFLFANVGEDSERKATLTYYREVAVPFAAKHGLDLIELRRVMRDGTTRTLREEIVGQPRSIPIPIRLEGKGPAGHRTCTRRFKIDVVCRWTKAHGATPENPATVAIGFTTDEFERVNTRPVVAWETRVWPLIDLGLTRRDCIEIVAAAGLPPAPRSACYFCPMHTVEEWREQAREDPDSFADSVALEEMLGDRRAGMGKDRGWFSAIMGPLVRVTDQGVLFDETDTGCDTGGCFT